MDPEKEKNYYISQKPKMMKGFDKTSKAMRSVLQRHYNQSDTDRLITNARYEYEAIIPTLSYIGGKKNFNEFSYIGSAQLLALIRTLEKEGANVRDIGEILFESFKEYSESMPGFIRWFFRRTFTTSSGRKKLMRSAERSQARKYPDDWVFEYVKGDGKSFDIGLDYSECAICKLYKREGAERYLPYMCIGDYPMFKTLGIGFKRTQTIGNGGAFCDFRLLDGASTKNGWPPEDLEEFKH